MKPFVNTIPAFDATVENTIKFHYIGNQVFKNTAIIKNNLTNEVVYESTQDSLQLKHIIPPNTLINGILYNIQIKVSDQDSVESLLSDPQLFYCYSSPLFNLNITDNQIIKNSSYVVTLDYQQNEGELIQSYKIELYGKDKTLIWDSGIYYNTDSLTYTISGLEDKGVYYVRATGITVNGIVLDTDYILFYVDYKIPSVYSLFTLTNRKKYGDIHISSNIKSIEGSLDKEAVYINNKYIYLLDNSLKYEIDINGNFLLNLKGYNIKPNLPLIIMKDKSNIILIKCYFASLTTNKHIFELSVNPESPSQTGMKYVIYSDEINIENDDVISLWIHYINGLFNIIAIREGKVV